MCSKECSFNVQCIFSVGELEVEIKLDSQSLALDMLDSHTKKSDATVLRTWAYSWRGTFAKKLVHFEL